MTVSYHLEKRSKSTWTIVIEYERKEDGTRDREYIPVKMNKKDANMEAIKMVAEIEKGTWIKPSKTTVGEFLTQWLEGKRPNLAPESYRKYFRVINKYIIPKIGRTQLSKLTPKAIEDLKNDKLNDVAPSTVNMMLAVLNQSLDRAIKLEITHKNPVKAIERPKFDKVKFKVLDPTELEQLMGLLNGNRLYPIFKTLAYTGMRIGEVSGLMWVEVESKETGIGVFKIREQLQSIKEEGYKRRKVKSKNSVRDIGVSADLMEIINQLPRYGPYVFSHKNGNPITPLTIEKELRGLIKDTKFEGLRPHDFRHTHISLLLANGSSPSDAAARAGDTIQTILSTYAHWIPSRIYEPVKIFDKIMQSPGRQSGDIPKQSLPQTLVIKEVLQP